MAAALDPSLSERIVDSVADVRGRGVAEQSRIAALNALKRQIAGAALDNRQAFQRVITGAREQLGYTDANIAETFSCSRMTANRWIRGEAAPFAGMRIVIFRHLSKEIDRHLRALHAG